MRFRKKEEVIMTILVQEVNHEDQRYNTVGDWQFFDYLLHIKVSKMTDKRHVYLVAIHEIIEATLCHFMGISEEAVDEYDMNYKGNAEPGDQPEAPYYIQHKFATMVEKKMAKLMEVDWKEYEKEINNL